MSRVENEPMVGIIVIAMYLPMFKMLTLIK